MHRSTTSLQTFSQTTMAWMVALTVTVPVFIYADFPLAGDFTTAFKFCCFIGLIAMLFLITTLYTIARPRRYSIDWITLFLLLWVIYSMVNAVANGVAILDKDIMLLATGLMLFSWQKSLLRSPLSISAKLILPGMLLCSGLLEALVGLLQLLGLLNSLDQHFPITGTFKNPAPFSLYLAAIFPLSLATILLPSSSSKKWLKIIAILSVVAIIIVLVTTKIRAAWIAVLIGAGVIVFCKYDLKKIVAKKANYIFKGIALSILILLVGFGMYRLKPLSAAGRVLVWKVAIDKFRQHPILGVGYSNFKKQYNNWQGAYFREDSTRQDETYLNATEHASYLAGNIEMAYNEYLEIAVESGIIGLVLFLLPVVLTFYKAISAVKKDKDPFLIGALGGLTSILVEALFSYPLYSLPTFALFFVLLSSASMAQEHRPLPRMLNLFWQKTRTGLAYRLINCLISITTGILLLYESLTITHGYQEWKIARLAFLNNNREMAAQTYALQYPVLKNDALFLLDYGAFLHQNSNDAEALAILKKAKSLTSNPGVYLLTGQALQDLGQYDQALQEYESAHFIMPNKIYPEYLLANVYELQKDTLSAIRYAKKIIHTKLKVENSFSDRLVYEMTNMLKKYNYSE